MTFTKGNLKALKAEGTKLEKKVINVLLDQGTNEEIESYMKDVLHHGCQSGIVGELIYYSDTVEFFNKYKREINSILVNTMDELGAESPSEIFRDWDNEDPLAEDSHNQNLLAWFGFEETVRMLVNQLDLDI